MVTTVKHAALAYPPPDTDVEVVVTRHKSSQRIDTDMLTGEVAEYTNVELRAEAKVGGRTDHYRLDSYGPGSPTLWHEHGNGSSSSLQHPDTNNAVLIMARHSAEWEDPCDRYHAAFVLGSDLTAKVHTTGGYDHQTTQCGRDMTKGTRVLRITVDDDQWCGSCRSSY